MAIGKRVGDELYVHLTSVEHLVEASLRSAIEQALSRLEPRARAAANVAKVNTRSQRVSSGQLRVAVPAKSRRPAHMGRAKSTGRRAASMTPFGFFSTGRCLERWDSRVALDRSRRQG